MRSGKCSPKSKHPERSSRFHGPAAAVGKSGMRSLLTPRCQFPSQEVLGNYSGPEVRLPQISIAAVSLRRSPVEKIGMSGGIVALLSNVGPPHSVGIAR